MRMTQFNFSSQQQIVRNNFLLQVLHKMLFKAFSQSLLSLALLRPLFTAKLPSHNSITYNFTTVPQSQTVSQQQLYQTVSQQQVYTQRAFTPSQISSQIILELPKTPFATILHQLSLYSAKLIPFDYDYFVESLLWLTPHQNDLSMEELLMVFDLAIEYKIDNQLIKTHFFSQLYCRVYLMTKRELTQYDLDVKNQLDQTYQALEKQSADHFNLIAEQFKSLMEEDPQNQEDNVNPNNQEGEHSEQKVISMQSVSKSPSHPNKPTYAASHRKLKSKTLPQSLLRRITHIFLNSNAPHINFNHHLMQLHTIRLDQHTNQHLPTKQIPQLTPEFLLTYTKLAVNLLQLYMTEYQTEADKATSTKIAKYTRRSVKLIYKVQAFYYYEVAKLIEDKKLLEGATDAQLEDFLALVSSFPIKRRSFRKSIGDALIEQTKRRQLPNENLIKFFELSRFDNKLLQHFQNSINGIKQLPTNNKQQSIEHKTQKQSPQHQPLVPEVVDESHQQHQGLFKLPASLFRKVTKKKSKPKHKNFSKQSQEIDLTQPDQQAEIQTQNKKVDQQPNPSVESIQKQQIAK